MLRYFLLIVTTLGIWCAVLVGCEQANPVDSDNDDDDTERPVDPIIPDELDAPLVAFVGVNVVPMTGETVLSDQTVLIRNGEIAEIGRRSDVNIPANAERIEAGESWLMPGLADMHAHLSTALASGQNDLFLFIANGVTTVRIMEGDSTMLRWRDEINAGVRLGPTMFVSGPPLDGAESGNRLLITDPLHIETAEQGRDVVREHAEAGFDLIKIYNTLEPDVYEAILSEANARGIKAVGHVPVTVSLEQAIASGQYSTEHLNPFARSVVEGSTQGRWEGAYDEAAATTGAHTIAASGMWNCLTLAFYVRSEVQNVATRPELRYVSIGLQRGFTPANAEPSTVANTRRMTAALHSAGAKLILGSWTGARYLSPGFAVHDELSALASAGLEPFVALQTATVNASRFIDGAVTSPSAASFGAVEVGRRADLILLDANPLEDVRNADRRIGVMVRGRWFSESRLEQRLEQIATSYGR